MTVFLKTCCLGTCTGISFVDSTPARVCHNKRIKRNKVFKGYIAEKLTKILFVGAIYLVTTICNNMKKSLMTMNGKILLCKRSVIETINDELKNICQIEHSRQCSLTNSIAGLTAYSFLPKKPSISYQQNKSQQIVAF